MDAIEGTRVNGHDLRRDPILARSLTPMLIADDERRHVDANPAACLFLRSPQHEICGLRVDDLVAAHGRPALEAMWSEVLRDGGSRRARRTASWDLNMPDGSRVAVDISVTPHVGHGRHLLAMAFPAARSANGSTVNGASSCGHVLTRREREILTLVALGNTGVQIARQLFLSPATVASHVTNALVKLNAKNRAHGIAIALRTREIDLADRSDDPLPSIGRITANRTSSDAGTFQGGRQTG